MKLTFSLFAFLSLSYCFAQISPIKYFYKGFCKDAIPDFVALAVLEKQHCPRPINYGERFDNSKEEQICTSRYRIIRVLDTTSDTLKKEYIEARETPVTPYFRHRPILIFGKYKNGFLQIQGHEETRDYFSYFGHSPKFLPIAIFETETYAFHSIGTPYLNAKNLDSIDIVFYEYLMPYFRHHVEAAGKNFDELLLHLVYNRTPIKAAKIKNEFAALVVIKKVRSASSSKQANIYELSVEIENIFKYNAKIGPNIAIFIDAERLPPSWGCPDYSYINKYKYPFYMFGDLKNGNLVIESLVSTEDAFVFGDTIYDISMGFSFEELAKYFLPSNISIEEFKFGRCWGADGYIAEELTNHGTIRGIASLPDSLKKTILEIAVKQRDFLDNKRNLRIERKISWPFSGTFPFLYEFLCRQHGWNFPPIDPNNPNDPYYTEERSCVCRESFVSGYGVWGNKW